MSKKTSKYEKRDKRSSVPNTRTRKPQGPKGKCDDGNTSDSYGKSTGSGRMEDIHSNDISWWNRSTNYTDATSIQRNRIPGYLYDNALDGGSLKTASDPSVVSISYTPTIGISNNYNSPVNRSFTSLMAEIVAHTNSSNLGFTQASLAMITLASVSIVTNIAAAKRALGLRNVYFNGNANYPKVLYRACGFVGYDNVPWERYRFKLNTLIQDFNSLQLPKYISLFDRAFQLAYNMYADEDSVAANVYVFRPSTYYVYSDTENKVIAKEIDDFLDVNSLLNYIQEQLSAIRTTSDLGLIMGAYRRAFPETQVLKLEELSLTDVTIPWFDRNMTWQINNMSLIDRDLMDKFDITEDVVKDQIMCEPELKLTWSEGMLKGMYNTTITGDADDTDYEVRVKVNSYDGDMSSEFFMEASRLLVAVAPATNTTSTRITACGTEICHDLTVYNFVLNENNNTVEIAGVPIAARYVESDAFGDVSKAIYALSKFRNHPPMGLVSKQNDAGTPFETLDTRDLYRYTSMTRIEIEQLHAAALQSTYLINVPMTWK